MDDIEQLLKECTSVKKPVDDSGDILSTIIDQSDKFPIKFPIESIRCKTLKKKIDKNVLEKNIRSTYPLIHEKALKLFCAFLIHKREHGTLKEKALYKNMTVIQLVDRFLSKRSVAFLGSLDSYLLRCGRKGASGWEAIGTNSEKEPLVLSKYLSYDEMKLSAMVYVSGHTIFINNGSRNNRGVPTDEELIETNGVIIGLIGTRLNKKNVMEFQELVVTRSQNTPKNGYGGKLTSLMSCVRGHREKERKLWRNIWSEFYNEPPLTYEDAKILEHDEDSNISELYMKNLVLDKDIYFNNSTYRKHIQLAIDCALLEASHRASKVLKFAYLHVVGIGLGVWQACSSQDALFVKTFLERLGELADMLPGLSDVHLSYMKNIPPEILTEEGSFIPCDLHLKGGIQVHLSRREPSSKLTVPHEGKLLVETYAWDGNAQPGNEFWLGSLSTSGDPAAACSSQVSELHNSLINTTYVSGENVHVIGTHGVHHISQYAQLMLDEIEKEGVS